MFHFLSSDNSVYRVQQRTEAQLRSAGTVLLRAGVTSGSQQLLQALLLFNLSLRDDLSLPRTPINILVRSSQKH